MNKEMIKALRGLMIFAAVLVLAVLHLDKVIMFIGLVIGILRPFLIGAAVAFIINIPMKAIEGRLPGPGPFYWDGWVLTVGAE